MKIKIIGERKLTDTELFSIKDWINYETGLYDVMETKESGIKERWIIYIKKDINGVNMPWGFP